MGNTGIHLIAGDVLFVERHDNMELASVEFATIPEISGHGYIRSMGQARKNQSAAFIVIETNATKNGKYVY